MKRQCKGTTKKGEPCKASPVKGTACCVAHSDEETRASMGFGGPRAGAKGGRPALPKPTEVARRLIEENVTAILRPHFLALGIELHQDGTITRLDGGAMMYGESKEGVVIASTYEDLGAQIAAAEKLLDRVYGRPKQQTEITGENGGPVEMVAVAREPEHAGRVAEILQGIRATP